jgi:hypothetical protein
MPGRDIGNRVTDQNGNEMNCGQRSLSALLMIQKYALDSMRHV